MSVTADPRAQAVKAFIRRKTVLNIIIYVAAYFIFLAIVAKRYAAASMTGLAPDAEFALGLGIGAVLLLFTYYLWRCPACGKALGFRFDPKACRHCKTGFTPDWKPDGRRDIFTSFSRRKKARFFLYAFLMLGAFYAAALLGQGRYISLGGLYFILGGIVLAFGIGDVLFWRCPNCRSHLGRAWNPAACYRCRTTLRK